MRFLNSSSKKRAITGWRRRDSDFRHRREVPEQTVPIDEFMIRSSQEPSSSLARHWFRGRHGGLPQPLAREFTRVRRRHQRDTPDYRLEEPPAVQSKKLRSVTVESNPMQQKRVAGRDRPAGARRPPPARADRTAPRVARCRDRFVAQAGPLSFQLRQTQRGVANEPNSRAAE